MSSKLNQLTYNEIFDGYQYNYAYDGSNNLEYLGKANPGATDADGAWSIVKFAYSGTNMITKRWASDKTIMDKVWNDRATYF